MHRNNIPRKIKLGIFMLAYPANLSFFLCKENKEIKGTYGNKKIFHFCLTVFVVD